MKEKDNKGFWDRWAKRYDFAMSGDGKASPIHREPLMQW